MEDINGACRSFAKSVNDYIDRALRRRGRRHDDGAATSSVRGECNDLVRHANLVLVTLTAKHASLANALAALRAESKDYVERFSAAAASSSDVERVHGNSQAVVRHLRPTAGRIRSVGERRATARSRRSRRSRMTTTSAGRRC